MTERDYAEEPLQVVSFGGGTQSSAMLILIDQGRLPKPDIVMFADTGEELPATLAHVERARELVESWIDVPFEVVMRPDREALLDWYAERSTIPLVGFRGCTEKFKITPQRHAMRRIVGRRSGKLLAESWLGITTDEERRRRDSDVKWAGLKYPLLDLDLSREDCLTILDEYGWGDVVKSGCHCCPYQSHTRWEQMRKDHPELFERALNTENKYRAKHPNRWIGFLNSKNEWLEDFEGPTSDRDESGCAEGCFI